MNYHALLCAAIIAGYATVSYAAFTNFVNFETAPVHPVTLGPDGRTLAVCNLPDARIELFDVANGIPTAVGSVAVGIDPVTVRFASTNEVWAVNHISSTISIIDVAARNVIATLETPAGPSDLVFAGTPRRAWISCSRTNSVFVIDPATRAAVTNITIDAERPRAMAVSPDGSTVYVAIFESGNGSTILGRKLTDRIVFPPPGPVEDVRGPYGGRNPPPNSGTNFSPALRVGLPAPPKVSHIVRKNAAGRWMDDNDGDWTEWVSGTNATISGRTQGWDLADRDVAIIDTVTYSVGYANRLMNICMAIAVNPANGAIAVVGTDATNERRFEPVINGVFLRVPLALVDPVTRTNRLRDLNPHLDYVTRTLPETQRALSISDCRGIEWNSAGTRAYITGMGSRNLIVVNADGARVDPQPIELGEGPTGLALDEVRERLYVWNRFSSSLSVVDTSAGTVITNVPVFDPTPDVVRKGRRHLYDARKTSGLGLVSCASCHVDGRGDRLAWDLGDPAGTMVAHYGKVFHPMKGPMVTQTFQDIINTALDPQNSSNVIATPLHWRGDRKNIEEFNPTFTNLMANDVVLTSNEMAEFKAMLSSVSFPPNFLRTFSNTLADAVPLPGHFGTTAVNGARSPLPPGSARRGLTFFQNTCNSCHEPDRGVTTDLVLFQTEPRFGANFSEEPRFGAETFKFAQLRSVAEKVGMDGRSTNSRAGFGFMHDGRIDTLTRFIVDGFGGNRPDQTIADITAFLLSFSGSDLPHQLGSSSSQDVPAAVGRQVTFATPNAPSMLNAMFALALRTNSRVELVLHGKKDGRARGWLMRRANGDFQSDRRGEMASSLAEAIATAAPGNELTATLVPEGCGVRIALDRDSDGHFNTTEIELGYDAADATSHPIQIVGISKTETNVILVWQSSAGSTYTVETTTNFSVGASSSWSTLSPSVTATTSIINFTSAPPAPESLRFYRIRKEQ